MLYQKKQPFLSGKQTEAEKRKQIHIKQKSK